MASMLIRKPNPKKDAEQAVSGLNAATTESYMDGSVSWRTGARSSAAHARPALNLVKRLTDFSIAAVLLVILMPLFLAIGLAIKMTSRGPVFYRQVRCGRGKVPFRIMKFRTMSVCDKRPAGTFRQTARNDPRVTRVGRFLRSTSLDELPQLINVLNGEMSLVGPRPHALEHDLMFANRVNNYWHRYAVLPGITGWAQIHGSRGATDTDEKMLERVALDNWYVDNRSFLLDLKILLLTPRVLAGGNAY